MDQTAEGRYEHFSRIVEGLCAIEHLIIPLPEHHDIREIYKKLCDQASEYHAMARERNMMENEWVYGEETPSPKIHPDHTDKDLRCGVIVCIVDKDDSDVDLYTVGPFPMDVEDPTLGEIKTIESEEDLMEFIEENYESFTTTRPMPFATRGADEK